MERLLIIGGLFVVAGLCEIGGGYLVVWGWVREHEPLVWALLGAPVFAAYGAPVFAAYGVVAALQPIPEVRRVYAAYGGVFIALALAWGVLVDGFRPDHWDLLGAAICVAVMVASRGSEAAPFAQLPGGGVLRTTPVGGSKKFGLVRRDPSPVPPACHAGARSARP